MSNKYNANKHRGRHIFRFNSRKNGNGINGCAIKVESFLEYCYACIFECDPNIISFASQVETMHSYVAEDEKTNKKTPDFLVQYVDGSSEYIEVHWSKKVDAEYRGKIEHFSNYSSSQGQSRIRIVTELGLTPLIRVNYQLISDCMAQALSFPIEDCELPEHVTLNEVIETLSHHTHTPIEEAYYLIGIGYYEFNMSSLLQCDTALIKVSLC
jgi:hypothetical protein